MALPPLPTLGPRSRALDFWAGFTLPWRAVRCIQASPALKRWTAFSALLTCLALGGLAWLLGRGTPTALGWVWARPDGGALLGLWKIAAVAVFLALFAIGASTLPLLLLAPLQDPMSEATEALYAPGGGQSLSARSLIRGVGISLAHTAQRIAWLLFGHAVLLPLHLFVGAGSLLWATLSLGWTAWWSAAEYLSLPLARHHRPFAEVRRGMRARPFLAAGFGLAVALTLWIPVLNLFLVPLAVVGGTLYFRVLQQLRAIA